MGTLGGDMPLSHLPFKEKNDTHFAILIKTGPNLLRLITEFPSWPEIEDNMTLEHARHLLFPFFKYGDHMKD